METKKKILKGGSPTLIGTSTLQILISLASSTECLKKLEKIIYPQKFCHVGYKISPNYSLFFDIKRDGNKTISNFRSPKLN